MTVSVECANRQMVAALGRVKAATTIPRRSSGNCSGGQLEAVGGTPEAVRVVLLAGALAAPLLQPVSRLEELAEPPPGGLRVFALALRPGGQQLVDGQPRRLGRRQGDDRGVFPPPAGLRDGLGLRPPWRRSRRRSTRSPTPSGSARSGSGP